MTPAGLLPKWRRRTARIIAFCALSFAAAGCFILTASSHALPATFATAGSAAGQISENPQGIAIDQETGDVYVSDTLNNRIDKFGPEGEFILAWGWGVADGETEALQTCTTATRCFRGLQGAGVGEFFSGEFSPEGGAAGIAVDNDASSFSHGDVFVVDQRSNRVQVFGPNGEFRTMFGGEVNSNPSATNANICAASEAAFCRAGVEGSGPGQFAGLNGRSIAVDTTTGLVHVADINRVQRFSEVGVLEGEVALPAAGFIENLAVDSANDIYLKGSEPGVREYDPLGVELGGPRDEAGTGTGLSFTVGPADGLFVNDFRGSGAGIHHILSFSVEGEELASFDAGGLGVNGQRGIAYSEHTEALYVLNGGAVRIVTPPPPGPFVLLGSESSSDVEPTTATLHALVNPEGAATEYHFEYGTTTTYGESTAVSAPLTAVNEVQSVTVAATGGAFTLAFKGESSGEVPFDATAAEVQGALEAVPGLGAGQVAVSGEPGGPWLVEFTGSLAGQDVPELSAGAGSLTGPEPGATVATTTPGLTLFDDRAASASIKGLVPGTLYHFRVVATDGSLTNGGPDQTFTTLPTVSIDHTSVSQVNATSARLEADLNPHGLASEYHFEYGTSTAYGTTLPQPDGNAGSGTTDTTVSNPIQGLLPSTTYHYRVIAHNALNQPGEVVEGPDRSFTTQGSSSVLADGRTWELVSPPNKHGFPLEPLTEEGGLIQSAPDGGAFAYVSLGSVNGESAGVRSPHDSQLLAQRDPSKGWSTQDITTPHEEISIIRGGFPSEYKFFAEDLSAGVVEPEGVTRLDPQNPANTERTPYRREASGAFVPLVTTANVPAGTKFGGEEPSPGTGLWGHGVEFVTATPDLSHIVLSSSQVLAPGFAQGFEPNGIRNQYELVGGVFTLVSVLPGEPGQPAAEAGDLPVLGGGLNRRGAISDDGNRVFFEAVGGGTHLYVRDVALAQTLELDQRQPGAVGGSAVAAFQAASGDGSRVFFTDTAQLTPDASRGPDLYMCEVAVKAGQLECSLSDLSVDQNPGEAAGVAGQVASIDASGSHVYFAATGVLTSEPNARGEVAVPGECKGEANSTCNLYGYDTSAHRLSLVAVVSSHDGPDWGTASTRRLGELTARSSPNGRWFTFMSQRSVTGYDNRDARSGQPDEEVYLFDAKSGKLSCVSCDPTGARPQGVFDKNAFPGLLVDHIKTWGEKWLAGSIPGWTLGPSLELALYQSRYLGNSGRMFFNASDALVPQDTNNVNDVYQFEPPAGPGAAVSDTCTTASPTYSPTSSGCVSLVSSGGSKEESAFLDASESGDEVFFLTESRLVGSDVDSAFDVYDAHVCSSSSPCPPPPPPPPAACEGDSCQNPSSPPADQIPGSQTYKGPENQPPPAAAAVVKAKSKPLTRAQKLAGALKACRRKPKSTRRACERVARRKYAAFKVTRSTHKSNWRAR